MGREEQDHERADRSHERSEEAHWQVAEAGALEEEGRLEAARQSDKRQDDREKEGGVLDPEPKPTAE